MASHIEGSAALDAYPMKVEVLSAEQIARLNVQRVFDDLGEEAPLGDMFAYLRQIEGRSDYLQASRVLLVKERNRLREALLAETDFDEVGVVRAVNNVLDPRERGQDSIHPDGFYLEA